MMGLSKVSSGTKGRLRSFVAWGGYIHMSILGVWGKVNILVRPMLLGSTWRAHLHIDA